MILEGVYRWLLLLTTASCIDSRLVDCGDWLCPAGTACDVAHHSCVEPSQLAACSDLPDLTMCTTAGITAGHCFGGVCIEQGCGNGYLEPGELCDDGNVLSADGCSADCASTERCGDGVIDLLDECDDGNQTSHDGCSSVCRFEDRIWRQRSMTPTAHPGTASAYDSVRHTFVMFGGYTNVSLGDTWEFDGRSWTDATMPTSPSPRQGSAMAYDPVRHEVVLFGGLSINTAGVRFYDDTWIWNGVAWRRARPTTGPPARFGHAMGWDGANVIMFGGSDAFSSTVTDTWRWTGSDWSLVSTTTRPPSAFLVLVFDSGRRRLLGLRRDGQDTEVWQFENGDWRLLPSRVANFLASAAAYDGARDRIVVAGAVGPFPSTTTGTWELIDMTWEDHTVAGTAAPSALWYDVRRGNVVALNSTNSGPLASEWDGASWTGIPLPSVPAPRRNAGLASDPLRGRMVLFGGAGPLGDTWEWDGSVWQQVAVGASPEPRELMAMAFDGSAVLMFGGSDASGPRGDTWRWDGTLWTPYGGSSPPARIAPVMAYDADRRRVVLFGGTAATLYDDTWEWDGSTWSLSATSGPPARAYSSASYDPVRRRVVVFGGLGASGALDDTWEWDGAVWTERVSSTTPLPRRDHQLVFDRARRRTSLLGGLLFDISLWEWDGQAWSHESALSQPTGRQGPAAAYDDVRGQILMFGGYDNLTGIRADTWTGSYLGSPEEVCESGLDIDGNGASGCDDTACRFLCEPACLVDSGCNVGPRCGNGVCDGFETDRLCPRDPCPPTPAVCGDGRCSLSETCPGDC